MNKYECVVGWYSAGSLCIGESKFDTLPELIQQYEYALNLDNVSIKRIGLTSEYLNSLSWMEKEKIKFSDNLEIQQAFKEAGHDIFIFSYGCLFLK